MKIPFIYKYDASVELIKNIDEKKLTIKKKIYECQDIQKNKFIQSLILLIFGCIPFYVIYVKADELNNLYNLNINGIWDCAILGFVCALAVSISFEEYYKNLEQKYKRLLNDLIKEEIKEKVDEDLFENSIKLSYKYLDEYYSQTRKQAQKGFYVTVFVAVFGALLVASGIIIMYMGKMKPAYVTCATGVITEFISAIFFYLYNRTITSMSTYHNKLVLSQNISIALKVADSLPKREKAKCKKIIIEELLKDVNRYFIKIDNSENGRNNYK